MRSTKSTFNPIHDGVNEMHLARVREARKEVGLPVHTVDHPFRKREKGISNESTRIIFGVHESRIFESI